MKKSIIHPVDIGIQGEYIGRPYLYIQYPVIEFVGLFEMEGPIPIIESKYWYSSYSKTHEVISNLRCVIGRYLSEPQTTRSGLFDIQFFMDPGRLSIECFMRVYYATERQIAYIQKDVALAAAKRIKGIT